MSAGWLAIAPRSLPSVELMLDDIGADFVELAKYFGVSSRTVRSWRSRGVAPRAVSVALFFHTKWGRSYVHCDAENRVRSLVARIECAVRDRDALQAALDAALQLGDFGSANAPTTKVGTGAAAPGDGFRPLSTTVLSRVATARHVAQSVGSVALKTIRA